MMLDIFYPSGGDIGGQGEEGIIVVVYPPSPNSI